jgi:WhiB family redox-sensing transcriptional regulator
MPLRPPGPHVFRSEAPNCARRPGRQVSAWSIAPQDQLETVGGSGWSSALPFGGVSSETELAQTAHRSGRALQLREGPSAWDSKTPSARGAQIESELTPRAPGTSIPRDTGTHHAEPGALRTLGDHSWHDHAACRSTGQRPVDPEMFFPKPHEVDRIRAAKVLCAQCPVRSVCLEAALEDGDREGIRGGLTEEERDSLHRSFQRRLDYVRVAAVLAGRDVYLTSAERHAVVREAFSARVPPERLAWLLKITVEHAEKLYRRIRREVCNRLVDQQNNGDLSSLTAASGNPSSGACPTSSVSRSGRVVWSFTPPV